MVDLFLEAGFTYFDTAWAYEGSEDAIRQALVERYPREKFQLATKNAPMNVPNAANARKLARSTSKSARNWNRSAKTCYKSEQSGIDWAKNMSKMSFEKPADSVSRFSHIPGTQLRKAVRSI